jgi:FMN-dependent NADH-azoreductase
VMGEAAVAEALDAARAQLTGDAVFASLAAQATRSASMAASEAQRSA